MNEIILKKSNRKDKKFMVIIEDKVIHFGGKGYSDYTIHKDKERKKRYIIRHKKNENWNKSGIKTAGFWSRWILWNKPSLKESIENLQKKYKINIKTFLVYN
jgi:hypothetical protein